MADPEEQALREDLARCYREVCALRLNELSSGNLSVRWGEGMLISPTGAKAETITADACVFVGPNGDWEAGRKPSSEWQMHAAIYRDCPRANAIVHTHSDNCVAVASHRQPLPGFHYLVGVFGGSEVPCIPYSTFGSARLAEDAAAALQDRSACLMANHGMICRAGSLNAAVELAQRLEIMCRQYVLARTMGEPARLTEAEWADFFEQIRRSRYEARD